MVFDCPKRGQDEAVVDAKNRHFRLGVPALTRDMR